jgi:hypothetical protein
VFCGVSACLHLLPNNPILSGVFIYNAFARSAISSVHEFKNCFSAPFSVGRRSAPSVGSFTVGWIKI